MVDGGEDDSIVRFMVCGEGRLKGDGVCEGAAGEFPVCGRIEIVVVVGRIHRSFSF